MVNRKFIFIIISLFAATIFCFGETFLLKDGTRITGDIVSHEDGIYTVSAAFGIVDLLEEDIVNVMTEEIEIKQDQVQEIRIETNAKTREFVPAYEDKKFYDPLYIGYTETKKTAKALTTAGAVFSGIGALLTAIGLPIHYNINYFASLIPDNQYIPNLGEGLTNLSLSIILPIILTPSIIGVTLILACIGPWVYANVLLKKWQMKYHVDMSYNGDADKLNVAFAIKL